MHTIVRILDRALSALYRVAPRIATPPLRAVLRMGEWLARRSYERQCVRLARDFDQDPAAYRGLRVELQSSRRARLGLGPVVLSEGRPE